MWKPFPGTQLSAFYGLPEFTVQEGFYEFYATAKNDRNEVTPCVPTTGCQPPEIQVNTMTVDPNGKLQSNYLPVISNN